MCKLIEWLVGPGMAAGVVGLIGVTVVFYAVSTFRSERQRFLLPTRAVRDAQAGPIEIAGEVVADALVTAPASGIEVVWYRVDIEEGVDTVDSEGSDVVQWHRVKRLEKSVPFWIDDGTGRARVTVAPVDVREEIAETETWRDGVDPFSDRVRELLHANGCAKGRYSVAETRLRAGTTLKVAGTASAVRDSDVTDRSYRHARHRTTIEVSGTEAEPIAIAPVDVERRIARRTAWGVVIGVGLVAIAAAVIVASALAAC